MSVNGRFQTEIAIKRHMAAVWPSMRSIEFCRVHNFWNDALRWPHRSNTSGRWMDDDRKRCLQPGQIWWRRLCFQFESMLRSSFVLMSNLDCIMNGSNRGGTRWYCSSCGNGSARQMHWCTVFTVLFRINALREKKRIIWFLFPRRRQLIVMFI